jgi:hypothetical protein
MSMEAVWTVRFGPEGAPESELNGGVAMIETNRIFGGDSGYAYIGDIKVNAAAVDGTLKIVRHNAQIVSMYGLDENEFELTFSGERVSDTRVEGKLQRQGYPSAMLVLTRLTELP